MDNSSRECIPESKNLPTVGARNALNAEGILSLKPTLVILGADSAPPQIFEQLRSAGIAVLTLTPNYTIKTVKSKVSTIAKAVGADAKAAEINSSIDNEMNEVNKMLANLEEKPKVMFVGRGPNMPNATMDSSLNFQFSILEVVLMGRAPYINGAETAKDYEIARKALAAVDEQKLEERIYPTLSGGERQRVQLARVLAQIWEQIETPRYLLLDEPTSISTSRISTAL